jgi:shikimate dehydrogenase
MKSGEKVTTGKNLYGLIGYPLSHSFSKKYFTEKFRKEGLKRHFYELFPIQTISQLPGLLERFPELKGLNVTIPYKEAVFPFLDELDPAAAEIGAVNTLAIRPDGKIKGFNTDVYGFEESLQTGIRKYPGKVWKALVFGSGGSSKAVSYVLEKRNIFHKIVSRNPASDQLAYEELVPETARTFNLLINCTPLGMHPDTEMCPAFPYHHLSGREFLFDLIYNPSETLFLKKGREAGCEVKNGLEMLTLQAEKAWEIWQKK